jgi:hypothetical protein
MNDAQLTPWCGMLWCLQAMQLCGDASSHASTSSSSLLQPLRDHHAITPNVMAALHGRERQLLTVMTLRQDLEDKRARLSAAQLMPASQANKVRVGATYGKTNTTRAEIR